MPITSAAVSVGTAAVELVGTGFGVKFVYVQNTDDATDVWVGGSTLGSATGILVSGSSPNVFQLTQDDALYAIASGTVNVNVLTVA
jgi:hypothetical protein